MSLPDFRIVQERHEGEIVPQGISITETIAAFYLNIQVGKRRVHIRQPKDESPFSASLEDEEDWREVV